MSHNATKWLAQNLPALRRVTYTDASGKERNAFRGEGFALAFFICDASNTYGTVMMTRETMSDKSGVSKVEIDRLIAAWIRGGFIAQVGVDRYMGRGRPTPIYALIGVPNEYKPEKIDAENARITIPISIPGDSSNLVEPLHPKENDYFLDSEPEPEPEPDSEPDPRSVVSESARQEKAGIFAFDVLKICIELETEDMALRGEPILPGLVKRWKAEYPSLIADAIGKGHNDTAENVAKYCHDVRTEARTGRPATGAYRNYLPRPTQVTNAAKRLCGRCGDKNRDIPGYAGLSTQYDIDPVTGSYVYTTCKQCNGTGYKELEPSPGNDYFPPYEPDDDYFPNEPTQEDTHKRVNTDQSSNTYIPTPGGSADPQSGARNIRDIEKGLLLRLTKPIKPLPD